MTKEALIQHYLILAKSLTGKDLKQVLDRIEDLLELRPSLTSDGERLPSGRTVITPEGAAVINRDGTRETVKRQRKAEPNMEQQIIRPRPLLEIA